MASGQMEDQLLPISLALPIFSADAISSVAYATEAAMVVLVGVSLGALRWTLPIAIAVSILMAIVVASYRQTVRAYAQSGGAYIVAKENLGKVPSLVAAAALLVDYVLTVAVSVAGGIFAITSAVSSLAPYRVELSLAAIGLIALVNLRGVKEAGFLFAIPTYGFIVALYIAIGTGIARCTVGTCPHAVAPNPLAAGVGRRRRPRSAAGVLVGRVGVDRRRGDRERRERVQTAPGCERRAHARRSGHDRDHVSSSASRGSRCTCTRRPSSTDSVLSQIARAAFPAGSAASFMYWVVQVFTFADPRARREHVLPGLPAPRSAARAATASSPRQFTNLGDRLVFSNGVVVLTGCRDGADRHLPRERQLADPPVRRRRLHGLHALAGGHGALLAAHARPGVAVPRCGQLARRGDDRRGAVVVIWSKFAEGAWLVIVAIPLLVLLFVGINRHYRRFAVVCASASAPCRTARTPTNKVLLWVESLDVATEGALWYARTISHEGPIRALLAPGKHTDPGIRPRWWDFAQEEPKLEILSIEEGRMQALLEEVWRLPRGESDFVTVVIPEQFKRSRCSRRPGRTSFRLKLRLLSEPGVVVTDVPVVTTQRGAEGNTPKRLVVRVLLANVHAGAMRAISYAQSLGVEDVRAVSFAFDADECRPVQRRVAACRAHHAAGPERRAVPRHRNAAPRLHPRVDRRSGHRGQHRHAGDGRPWLGSAAPQPAGALHQAAAALRAARDPLLGALPAVPLAVPRAT